MSQKFHPGDVVRVKSGGPNMTVAGYGDEGYTGEVWCEWFHKDEQKSGCFTEAVLEKVPDKLPASAVPIVLNPPR